MMKPLTERISMNRFERSTGVLRAIIHELRVEKVTFMAGGGEEYSGEMLTLPSVFRF
jgi:hypothetical protein